MRSCILNFTAKCVDNVKGFTATGSTVSLLLLRVPASQSTQDPACISNNDFLVEYTDVSKSAIVVGAKSLSNLMKVFIKSRRQSSGYHYGYLHKRNIFSNISCLMYRISINSILGLQFVLLDYVVAIIDYISNE